MSNFDAEQKKVNTTKLKYLWEYVEYSEKSEWSLNPYQNRKNQIQAWNPLHHKSENSEQLSRRIEKSEYN